jgi:4-hydroxy-3-methylbut-2-enyl diphosphate reductase
MKIIRAEHLGMCFGVRDAIALAAATARQQPLTILGELVHNESVLEDLRNRGVNIARNTEEIDTRAVMVTAHGASEKVKATVRASGHEVMEATCPLVHAAHRAVLRLAAEGYHPVLIGQRDHAEVQGLTGDLADFDVVLSEAEIGELRPRTKFGVAAQTTQPIERVRRLVNALRQKFPEAEVRFVDTVCQPTKQRQHSAVELAQHCDVVVVIGGLHSNNTRELARTCERFCARVVRVQTAEEVRGEWFEGAERVGLTAGTSTPDWIIAAVERRLIELTLLGVVVSSVKPNASPVSSHSDR